MIRICLKRRISDCGFRHSFFRTAETLICQNKNCYKAEQNNKGTKFLPCREKRRNTDVFQVTGLKRGKKLLFAGAAIKISVSLMIRG